MNTTKNTTLDHNEIALHAAFFMEGLVMAGYDKVVEANTNREVGFLEFVQEMVSYSSFAEKLIHKVSSAPVNIDHPSVFDYEVSVGFGKWFCESLVKNCETPTKEQSEQWMADECFNFFKQGCTTEFQVNELKLAFEADESKTNEVQGYWADDVHFVPTGHQQEPVMSTEGAALAINHELNGFYTGKILRVTDNHAIQKVGRDKNDVIIHDLSCLSKNVSKDENVEINYSNGRGVVVNRVSEMQR